ncbi:MAG: hypothetical protein WAW73_20285 [Rhodoferax sp.]
MITTAALYLAVGYASAGVAVFLYLLAYNLTGPKVSEWADDAGDWSALVVAVAVVLLLAFCILVWPFALRGHRRDVVRHRARSAWMDQP